MQNKTSNQLTEDAILLEIAKLEQRTGVRVVAKPAKKSTKLTARDFTYVYEPGIGQTYQNGPYLILVGNKSYAATYRGQTFSWGLEFFTEAIEACARYEVSRCTCSLQSNWHQEGK